MSPSDFAKLSLRNLPIIFLSVALAIAASFGLYLLKKPTYVADATAYVSATSPEGTTDSSYTGTLLAKQKVRSFIPVFTSRTTAERAIQQLRIQETPDAVAKKLQVTAPTDSVAINIKATGDTPSSARDLADAIVSAGAMEIEALEGGPTSGVKVVPLASAGLPSSPASPVLSRYLLLGMLAGLMTGYVVAFIRFRMDTRIRTITDVEETQNSIVLGTLPADRQIGRKAVENETSSDEKTSFTSREALRKLRTNLRFVSIDNPPRAIVVTSSQPKDGKSTVAVRLAQVIAASGSNVLLVDADLRRPTIASTLKLDGTLGLSGILTGDVFLDEAVQPTEDPHLHVLAAGRIPPNPSELLGSQRMKDLLGVLKNDYQYVIIDAPPLLQVTDGALLAASADGAIVVVRSAVTRKSELGAAVRHLNSVDAPVLGTVLNQVSGKRMSKIIDGTEYYGYGYGYTSAKDAPYASVVPTTESKQPAVANVPFLRSDTRIAKSGDEVAEVTNRGRETDTTVSPQTAVTSKVQSATNVTSENSDAPAGPKIDRDKPTTGNDSEGLQGIAASGEKATQKANPARDNSEKTVSQEQANKAQQDATLKNEDESLPSGGTSISSDQLTNNEDTTSEIEQNPQSSVETSDKSQTHQPSPIIGKVRRPSGWLRRKSSQQSKD